MNASVVYFIQIKKVKLIDQVIQLALLLTQVE